MLKKLFLSAAIVALVFTACDSESSTSPKTDDQSKEYITQQFGATENGTVEIKEPVIDTNPTTVITSDKATCQITEQTTTTLKMVMAQPDSGSITTLYEYKMDSLVTLIQFDFLPAMPQDSINAFCAEAKVDVPREVEEEGAVVNVTCGDNTITERIAVPSSFNPLPFIAPEMTEYCEEIQRTGIIPDDEDDI